MIEYLMGCSLSGDPQGCAAGFIRLHVRGLRSAEHQAVPPMEPTYYIGLDVHKLKIGYCLQDSGGKLCAEGWIPLARHDLDCWLKSLGNLKFSSPVTFSQP